MKKKKPSKTQVQCYAYVLSNTKKYTLTRTFLEKLFQAALDAKKEAILTVGLRRNKDEIFTFTGKIDVEKQKEQ